MAATSCAMSHCPRRSAITPSAWDRLAGLRPTAPSSAWPPPRSPPSRRCIDMDSHTDRKQALKDQILALVAEYYQAAHQKPAFVPGQSRIPYAGRVYDAREMTLLADSALDFWLTAGPYADRFERRMRQF